MIDPIAFELQTESGLIRKPILNLDIVAECQAWNLARANKETLIGVFPSPFGIHRIVLQRFT